MTENIKKQNQSDVKLNNLELFIKNTKAFLDHVRLVQTTSEPLGLVQTTSEHGQPGPDFRTLSHTCRGFTAVLFLWVHFLCRGHYV